MAWRQLARIYINEFILYIEKRCNMTGSPNAKVKYVCFDVTDASTIHGAKAIIERAEEKLVNNVGMFVSLSTPPSPPQWFEHFHYHHIGINNDTNQKTSFNYPRHNGG